MNALIFAAKLLVLGVAPPAVGEDAAPRALKDATVTVLPVECAGVVAGDESHVLTAAHCTGEEGERLSVQLPSGEKIEGTLVRRDGVLDVAAIRLDKPATGIRVLAVDPEPVEPGETVFFAGRNDRQREPAPAMVKRVGRCPSLPGVPAALFTTLRGEPGDSGAPLVDLNQQVVGLVHGGAACSIATPLAPFAAEFEGLRQSCVGK